MDIMIHPVLQSPTEAMLQEFPQLVETGCTTIKVFMCTEDFDAQPLTYLKAFQAAKQAGMLTMVQFG